MRTAARLLEREGDPKGFHEGGSFWGRREGVAPFFATEAYGFFSAASSSSIWTRARAPASASSARP